MSTTTESPARCERWMIDLSLLTVRVIAGVIFAVHGAQKVLGAFGGKGLQATVEQMGPAYSYPVAYLVAFGEFLGGIGLVIGLLTRFSAASLIVIMIGAIATVHGKNGLLQSDGGFEYNLALIGLLVPALLLGPGRIAITEFLPFPKSKRTGRTIVYLE